MGANSYRSVVAWGRFADKSDYFLGNHIFLRRSFGGRAVSRDFGLMCEGKKGPKLL